MGWQGVTDMQLTVLLIEDEPPMRKFLRVILETHDYAVIDTSSGEEGLRRAVTDQPDLILLDLGLPDMDGVTVTARLREWSATPIIVVSARRGAADKIVALDAGADDYLTKPFGVGELLARVRAAMRRRAAARKNIPDPIFAVGDLRIDLAHRRVITGGNVVHLTPNEFSLLAILVKNAGKVLTHRQLLQEVLGPGSRHETHYLRVYMSQLRQKLEADSNRPAYLLTEPGIGYRLAMEVG
jgi:two-component system KDP operon response regulator KdpE